MKTIAVVAVAMLSLPFAIHAEEVDERRDVVRDGLVKIKNLRGDIRIEGWGEDEIRVQGDLDELSTGLRFEVQGDETQIEVQMPRRDVNWGDGSDLVIQVPSISRIAVDSVSTDVYAENLDGGVQLRTVSGEIELRSSSQTINLATVSGRIEVRDSSGDLRARSSSGEIELHSHQGNADVETMSGEINLVAREAERLRGSTISGQIEVEVSFLQDVQAEFTSVSGEITIEIDDPENLSVSANSISGEISNYLTDDAVKEGFGQNSLRTQIGDGSGSLNVRVVSGAIEIDEG